MLFCRYFLYFFLTIAFSIGCNRRSVVKETAPMPVISVVVIPTDSVAITPPKAVTSDIKLVEAIAAIRKTACFGSCPVFEVQVYSDGTVEWNGKRFVERTGKYRAKASPVWIDDLIRYAQEQGFFNFSAHYPQNGSEIADIPHIICTIQRGAIRHTVDNGGDAPIKLRQFEDFFTAKLEELIWEAVRE